MAGVNYFLELRRDGVPVQDINPERECGFFKIHFHVSQQREINFFIRTHS